MATRFVPEEIVPRLQADLIQRYGGRRGRRDSGLLSSALAQPRATAGGKYLHRTVFDKAAAYGYHLARNHPFVDGNKRTGAVAALVFLAMNDVRIDIGEDELENLVRSIAEGTSSKSEAADFFRLNAVP
jgi:death-on-curing protein